MRSVVALAAVAFCAAPAAGQSPTSGPLAAELVRELEQRKLQNVAARDPERPGFFVAASHIPGVQLLVVSARSTAPAYVDYVLAESRYDEVYASLNGASAADGKLFVQDMGSNGLLPKPHNGGPVDVAYRDVTKMAIFNGEWKKQGLSEQAYGETFEAIDAAYARALSLLLRQLKPPAAP